METKELGKWYIVIQNPYENEYEVMEDKERLILLNRNRDVLIYLKIEGDHLLVENVSTELSCFMIADLNEMHISLKK